MTEFVITLPWPPSVNHYKKVGQLVKTNSGKMHQKRVNSNETISYYYQVYMISKQNTPLKWCDYAQRKDIFFDLKIDLFPPDKRKRDIDNVLKVLLDSLVHAHVIIDDSQISRLFIQKLDTMQIGQVIVKISPITFPGDNLWNPPNK